MGDKGGAPQPPDFLGLAREQGLMGQQNVREATIANRPNISTPFGSQAWTQSPLGGGAGGEKGGGQQGGTRQEGLAQQRSGRNRPEALREGGRERVEAGSTVLL